MLRSIIDMIKCQGACHTSTREDRCKKGRVKKKKKQKIYYR